MLKISVAVSYLYEPMFLSITVIKGIYSFFELVRYKVQIAVHVSGTQKKGLRARSQIIHHNIEYSLS